MNEWKRDVFKMLEWWYYIKISLRWEVLSLETDIGSTNPYTTIIWVATLSWALVFHASCGCPIIGTSERIKDGNFD